MLLLDSIVQSCDAKYSSFGNNCGCSDGICNRPSGQCSGSCYNCLYHIHYPYIAPANSKITYDCPKMLYHYVCQYSYLYTTELVCAFWNRIQTIKFFPYYHVLSLGCGGCADLMAYDYLYQNKYIQAPISYYGIDINNLWAPIHDDIEQYCLSHSIRFDKDYIDVFARVKETDLADTNIIVMSYLISSLYNRNQIDDIHILANDLAKNVICQKSEGMPLLLVINDVNSNSRGRDYFSLFISAIKKTGLSVAYKEYRYFDTGNLNEYQKIGTPYSTKRVPFIIPEGIQQKYHAYSSINSTIQLIVEVS